MIKEGTWSMLSRRERRQFSADMELGRRHPYLYGASGGLLAAAATATVVIVLLACWVIAPQGTLTVARWTAGILGGLLACWLFWRVALRRR